MKTIKFKTRKATVLILTLVICFFSAFSEPAFTQETPPALAASPNNNSKPFVVYYSRTGRARMVANSTEESSGL